ncbi:MAG: HAD hydrolase family protein [Opitutaceae bacterium]|nr:HAD hydrolase family protein [Opitutaceae bacterium]
MPDTATTPPIRLFSSDLDGTLLGNPESSRRFCATWDAIPRRDRPILVYNTGRLVDDVRRLVDSGELPAPDFVIGGVGTQMVDWRGRIDFRDFTAHLAAGWNLKKIRAVMTKVPRVRPQPAEFLHEFKSSWFLERATRKQLDTIRRALDRAGLEVHLVYSSHRDLDVVPLASTKGGTLAWLCAKLKIDTGSVLVAGDTGNDSSMFLLPGVRGIIPDNGLPELFEATVHVPIYTSREVMADGVLDGLRHFGLVREPARSSATSLPPEAMRAEFRMLFSGEQLGTLLTADRELLRTGYARALDALRRNITPLGFSACSLKDNSVTGTDANYRSVWARDGSITILNTLDLEDTDVRTTARNTLDTLLRAISPTGQIPANVRLDDQRPDYAGVGNICSIDSGLWVIIAFYNYYQRTHDTGFLHEHIDHLQRAMNWLSAHDSNNDGLLEIPEAGDWTDLFGRSYNVLYDEVLWFRANVCFGRLLEFVGDFTRAADYLRWSQTIRSRVLDTFWPTTRASDNDLRPNRFADRQFSLGDTSYLIAEVTPFSFNWRCDVFGNVLASLMYLLDPERARQAFHFMWGVGVNQPWPVANLYPVVQAGDPDWRAYYTVNLLNLPHHYHNGGIWPFVGGMWVRFIHRLGFHDVACRELVRLAEVNRLGRGREWEFNEWVHGQTGRPMGKAYQAWSAACFIRACHELEADPAHLAED